jgi:hypothetical protein
LSMPSQVGITLGIVQALYHKPVALAKLDTTAFSNKVGVRFPMCYYTLITEVVGDVLD